MGHRNSSAQFSGNCRFCAADAGITAPAAAREHRATRIADPRVTQETNSIGKYALLFLVRCYMIFLSPFFGGACKFEPSCSNYAYEAISRHGARRGTVLALKRLLRCRPFTVGGLDPVPDSVVPRRAATELEPIQ